MGGLSCAERDDAANRVIRGDANSYTVAGNYLDPEAPHPSAQLRQHFMARVARHAVQPARMDGNDRSLHINQIVFAQSAHPFIKSSNECATTGPLGQVQCFPAFGDLRLVVGGW